MRRYLFLVITAGLLALSAIVRAESLEELDRIVTQHGSLDGFLADAAAVDAYFAGLQKYYGADKMPRHRFDKVMGQLRDIVVKIPELKERLWETTNLGEPFAMEADVKGRGRDFKPDAWHKHFDAWGKSLSADAKLIYDLPTDARAKKAQDIFDRITKEIAEERAKPVEGRGRVADTRRNAEIFGKVRADGEVRAALAYVLREKLHEEHTMDLFHAGDPDVILHLFEKMRGDPRSIAWGNAVQIPPDLHQMLGAQVPPLKDLMAKEDIFPIRMRVTNRGVKVPEGAVRKGAYQAVPLPRRFHGIWKGIPLGECVGGSPVGDYETWLTPERWLTVALKDTSLWHIERDGGYHGFVQAVPIQVGGKTYGSIDFGSPLLAKEIQETDPVTGEGRSVKIFDKWLELVIAQKPRGWEGYVVGQSDAINNAGVLPTARGSILHQIGTTVGDAKDMTHVDPLAARIVEHAVSLGNRTHYRGSRMIFDAGVADAKKLRLLVSPAALRAELLLMPHAEFLARNLEHLPGDFTKEIYETRARHVETADQALELAAKILGRQSYLGHSEPVTHYSAQAFYGSQRTAIDNMLTPWLRRGDANWIARATQFFAFDGQMSDKIFEVTRLPHLDTAAKFTAAVLDEVYPPELRLQLLNKFFDKLMVLEPTTAELISMGARVKGLPSDTTTKLIALGYERAKDIRDAAEVIRALSPHLKGRYNPAPLPVPSAGQIAGWLAKNPSTVDIGALGRNFATSEEMHAQFVGHLLKGEVPIEQFAVRIGETGANTHIIGQLGARSVERFLALKPTAEQALAFARVAYGKADEMIKLATYAAEHAISLDQYFRAVDIPLNSDSTQGVWGRVRFHRQSVDPLVEASMDNFFRLKPTLADVKRLEDRILVVRAPNEFRRYYDSFDTAVKVVTALKQRAMPLVKGMPDYLRLASIPSWAGNREAGNQPAMTEIVKGFMTQTKDQAEHLPVGPGDAMTALPKACAEVAMTFLNDENSHAAAALLERGLGKAKSFGEYMGLIGSYVAHDNNIVRSWGRAALFDAVARTLGRVLPMGRTPDQLEVFRAFFAGYDHVLNPLTSRLVEEATTSAGVIEVVKAIPRSQYSSSTVVEHGVAEGARRLVALAVRPTLDELAKLANEAGADSGARGAVYERYIATARGADEVRLALARMYELTEVKSDYNRRMKKIAHVGKPVADKVVAAIVPHYAAVGATFEDLKKLEATVAFPGQVESLAHWRDDYYGNRGEIAAVDGIEHLVPTLLAIKVQLARIARNDDERYRAIGLPDPPWKDMASSPFPQKFRAVQLAAMETAFATWKEQLLRAPSARDFAKRVEALYALAGGEDFSAKHFREVLLGELLSPLMPHYLKYPDAAEHLPRLMSAWSDQPAIGNQLRGAIIKHGSVEDFLRMSKIARHFEGGEKQARARVGDLLKKNPKAADVAAYAGHWAESPAAQREIFAEAGKTLPTRAEIAAQFDGNPQRGTADLRTTMEGMAMRFFSLPVDHAESVRQFWQHGGWSEGVLPVLLAETPANLAGALEAQMAIADAAGRRRDFAREVVRLVTEKFFGLNPTEVETNRVTAALGDTQAREIFVTRALEHFSGKPAARELAMPSFFTRSRLFNETLRRLRPEGGISAVRRLCRFVGLVK